MFFNLYLLVVTNREDEFMITLIFIIIFTFIALKIPGKIRRYEISIYLLASVVAILSLVFNSHFLFAPIIKGFVGLALFYLVMIASSLKVKTKLRKGLMGLRKHYSILGFILITPHAVYYLIQIITGNQAFTPFGIAAYGIMIPLFITSFLSIRKKMKPSSWKNLQRLAYISYGLLLIHLILHYTNRLNLILYLILAVLYFYLKFSRLRLVKFNKTKLKSTSQS